MLRRQHPTDLFVPRHSAYKDVISLITSTTVTVSNMRTTISDTSIICHTIRRDMLKWETLFPFPTGDASSVLFSFCIPFPPILHSYRTSLNGVTYTWNGRPVKPCAIFLASFTYHVGATEQNWTKLEWLDGPCIYRYFCFSLKWKMEHKYQF